MTRPSTYLITLLVLLALSLLTFGLSYVHLGNWSVALAMLIATGKASLVALFFMHLREHGVSDVAAIVVGIMLTLLLIGLAAADVATRTRLTPVPF